MKTLGLFLMVVGLSSCTVFHQHQTAQTLGKGHSQVSVIAGRSSLIGRPQFNGGTTSGHYYGVVGMRYGVADRWDVGLSFSNFSYTGVSVKRQFWGDSTRWYAGALGFNLSSTPGTADWEFDVTAQLPWYSSFHFSDQWVPYVVVHPWTNFGQRVELFQETTPYRSPLVPGFTAGVLLGKNQGFSMEWTNIDPLFLAPLPKGRSLLSVGFHHTF